MRDVSTRPTRELVDLARAGSTHAARRLFDGLRPNLIARVSEHAAFAALDRIVTPDDVITELWLRFLALPPGAAPDYAKQLAFRSFLFSLLDRTLADLAGRFAAAGATLPIARPARVRRGANVAPRAAQRPDAELRAVCAGILDADELAIWRCAAAIGASTEDIALRMGIPAATVRGLMFRARGKVIAALARRIGHARRSH
jgi:DNA-directed RNA polymerase specialized sigma24 family protein